MPVVKLVMGLLVAFITMPIWYYLLYRVLVAVNATEVMWLLYFIYLPVGLFVSVLQAIVNAHSK